MKLKNVAVWFWHLLTRRAWLKLISIVLALCLWAYIVGNNQSLTRNKILTGVSVNSGTTTSLTSRSLALATDILSEYEGEITATVRVPQSRYASIKSSMIRVTPDYSGIYQAGTYEVPLTATCAFGTVTKLTPDTITVEIDALDTRELQVDVNFDNSSPDYYYTYDASSTNPRVITVSGPASLIQTITGAETTVDVKDRVNSFRRAQLINFTTADGSSIPSKLVTKSSSSCSVKVEIYPKKVLEVHVDESLFHIASGYHITEISCMPATVTVAAAQELLDSLDYLPLEIPSNRSNASKTFTARMNVSGIDDFKYISASQVFVTVTISEDED